MAASTKGKFDAAVNVIKSLPKNGNFQPSKELMLEFYGYFKQATEGPCNLPKPSFWDVVKRAKWDAWNKLGQMSKDKAMLCYVEELKKIIETMPQTQMVAEFMETLGTFYELVEERPLFSGQKSHSEPSIDLNGMENDSADISRDLSIQLSATEKKLSLCNGDLQTLETQMGSLQTPLPNTEESSNSDMMVNGDIESLADSEENSEDISDDISDAGLNESPRLLSQPRKHGGEESEGLDSESDDRESESEAEEFCDSTDQIHEMHTIENTKIPSTSSTPKRSLRGTFQDKLPMSPARVTRMGSLPFSPVISHLSHLRNKPLSDSLAVNSPGEESLNMTLEDVSDCSHFEENSLRLSCDRHYQSQGAVLHPTSTDITDRTGLNEQIAVALVRVQQELNSVLSRLDSLERSTRQRNESMWWPLNNLNRKSLFFVVVWPILVHFVLRAMFKRRRPQS